MVTVSGSPRTNWIAYVLAFLATAACSAATGVTWPIFEESPQALFLVTVVLIARYSGIGPGLFAAALSSASLIFFFIKPYYSFYMTPLGVGSALVFLLTSVLLSSVTTALAGATDRELQQRLWFEGTLASIGDAVIATDTDGRVTFMNPVAEQLVQWDIGEALGLPLGQVFHIVNEATGEPAESPVSKVLREGRAVGLANHTALIARGGARIPIDDSGAPIRDAAGDLKGIVLVFRDVTQRQQAAAVQARLAAIVESSDDAIITKDLDGVVTSWNAGAERIFGYRPEEILGRPVRLLIPADRQHEEDEILDRIRRGERVEHFESVRLTRDGRRIDVSLTISPVRDATGRIVGASKIARDITERKAAGDALREAEVRMRSVVNHVVDGIITIDERGLIEAFNPAAEKIFGYRAAEVLGQNVKMLMPEPYHGEHDGYLANYYRTGQPKIIGIGREVVGRRKDGSTFPMELAVSEFRLNDRRFFTGIVRDITERKRLEQELRSRLDELEETDRRKDEFLAMLAHELRNPLAAINSAVQLSRGFEDRQQSEWSTEVIDRQIKHLARLIDDLLDVSRITRGKIQLQKETVDVAPILKSAVETVRPLLDERKHELSVSVTPGTSWLEVDPTRLEQIVSNLLSNAAKYTDNGGHISLSADREGQDIIIRVRDTGIGIAPEKLPQMFELFVQGHRSLARSEGGLGIGLTLVRSLTQMHGGSVTASSRGPGTGSEFTIRLPAAERPETRVGQAEPLQPGTAASRVLVVDDNVDLARGLAQLLKLLGHESRMVHDGEAAIEAARSFRPEVVLLDIGLPGMDGYQVARLLRTEDCGRHARIIAITGYGHEEDRRRSREAGFDHHLVKPIDFKSLVLLLAGTAA